MLNNDTTLYLLSNIDISEEHQIDFDSETAQNTYFLSKKVLTLINSENNLDFKYIKDNNSINVGFFIDDLMDVNYVMYKNNDKWYYEKITSKEYINPNTTKLTLKLDVYQTFMFDFSLGESFVEREHQDRWELDPISNKLTPIYNLESEQLDKGDEYIAEEIADLDNPILATNGDIYESNSPIYWLCVITSNPLNVAAGWWAPNNRALSKSDIQSTSVNNVPSNAYTYYIPFTKAAGLVKFAESSTGFFKGSNVNDIEINSICQDPLVISASIVRQPPFTIKYSTTGHYYYLAYKENVDIECYAYIGFINDKLTENNDYRGAIFFIEQTPRNYIESQPKLTYNFNRLVNQDQLNILIIHL